MTCRKKNERERKENETLEFSVHNLFLQRNESYVIDIIRLVVYDQVSFDISQFVIIASMTLKRVYFK